MWTGIIFDLALQLALGGLLLCLAAPLFRRATRRRRARWARAARAVRLPLLGAALVTLALAAVEGAPPAIGELPWLLLGAVAAAGCHTLLLGGRLERVGSLTVSRGQARLGGGLLALGALLLCGTAAFSAVVHGRLGPGPAAGLLLLGLAGTAGLLAGLSRKPRPGGGVGVLCYVGGQLLILAG